MSSHSDRVVPARPSADPSIYKGQRAVSISVSNKQPHSEHKTRTMANLFCTETCDFVTDLEPMSIDVQPMLDLNILTDSRVLKNMLNDERAVPKQD